MPLPKHQATNLLMDEVEVTTQRGHGKGGQHQNKVESAVRVVHKPTGIKVFINGRDQYRNKILALEILSARVAEVHRESIQQARNKLKAEQLGAGSRSGKLRTYNFIGSVVTDHRSGKQTHKIGEVMRGRFELLR
jgi:peptide chain release factor 1